MDDFDMGLLDDKTYMVSVLRQKMLGIAPVFTYRIKQEKSLEQDYLYVPTTIFVCRDRNLSIENRVIRII